MAILFNILLLFIAALFIYVTRPYKPPIFGIYIQQNGFYHIKYLFFYMFLSTRKFINQMRNKNASLTVSEYDKKLDMPQPLSDHPKAIDAVYFNTTSKDDAVVICGLARRPNGVCNSFMYLKVGGQNMMLTPKLPDTTLQQTSEEEGSYSVEGITLKALEPMETWSVQYKGMMKDAKDFSKVFNVELNAIWTAKFRHFDYDKDMSPSSMARDIARETWTRDYFQTLKNVHQTHYEQYGILEGKVKINEVEHDIKTIGLRDHSFGKFREWKNFHRYGLHFINLDNGDCLTVGIVCTPVCFSSLTIGFICIESEKQIYPVDSCNLELFRHGENLTPPQDYAFQFQAGGKMYTIQIDVIESPTFYIGDEHECRVVESLIKCKVNNVEGWGAAEWYYRNTDRNII